MSAQPTKRGWRQRIAQWLDPVTPQLKAQASNWSPQHEPPPEPQSTPPNGIIRVNVIRLKGYVRNQIEMMRMQEVVVHPPQYRLPPPAPRQQTDAIRLLPPAPRHSDTLLTLPPTRHDPSLHMAPEVKREVFSELGTVPRKHAPVQEDRMPGWGTPDWINSVQNIASFAAWQEPARAEMFADVRQPSRPLEDDEPTVEHERTKRNRMFNEAITGLLGKDEIA